MNQKYIKIIGCRTHNLKNVNLEIPKNKLIVISGMSGSGKTSLAFDTIYAEGQRLYVESLSPYSRQFLNLLPKPDCDKIEGLSPAIAIDQKVRSTNMRSTVATVTEIYDYLRLLFARVGVPHSPVTGLPIAALSISTIVDKIVSDFKNEKIIILSPIIKQKKGEHLKEIESFQKKGFQRIRLDGVIYDIDDVPHVNSKQKHSIEIIIDRLQIGDEVDRQRIVRSIELCDKVSEGNIWIMNYNTNEITKYSTRYACPESDFVIDEIQPRLFSFNNPAGACKKCNGIGFLRFFDEELVIPDKSLSVYDGAFVPYDNLDREILRRVFEPTFRYFGESIITPFEQLDVKLKNALVYGIASKDLNFKGVLKMLEDKYTKSESESVISELESFQREVICPDCKGKRLSEHALSVKICNKNIADIAEMSIKDSYNWFLGLFDQLSQKNKIISEKIVSEIVNRLKFLIDVGLDYLHLDRKSSTLSGGESQRIRLASQVGSGLTGVLYVLDEPSIGLHKRDNDKLIETIKHLRDLDNTVIVIEHDEDTIINSDYVIDVGPAAGVHGGEIVFSGTKTDFLKNNSTLTANYVNGTKKVNVKKEKIRKFDKYIEIKNANVNNLKNLNVKIPLNCFVCVTGVSGCGKSSLVMQTLYERLYNHFIKKVPNVDIENIDELKRVIEITQSPIGKLPISNPITYTDGFVYIREFFANIAESKARGYTLSRFSFVNRGGRCEACKGQGNQRVQMHFLPDVYVTCEECKGARYNKETLEITYNGKNIADVLDMTVDEACVFFENFPQIMNKLLMLQKVGLGYIKLGQQATTLSGGECQRIKLAKELSKKTSERVMYILDEPSTGLHFADIQKLLEILHTLVDNGNTVVVIEHNIDIIKTADWIIDMGPDGGDNGGEVIACGTPESISKNEKSFTGKYIKQVLNK